MVLFTIKDGTFLKLWNNWRPLPTGISSSGCISNYSTWLPL